MHILQISLVNKFLDSVLNCLDKGFQKMPALRNILLVEDNTGDIEFIKEIYFKQHQDEFNLITCSDLEAALMTSNESLELILLDLDLPDSRGIDTVHAIKNNFSETPIVVFSGRDEFDLIRDIMELGVLDYAIKGNLSYDAVNRIIRFSIARSQYYSRINNQNRTLSNVTKKLTKKISETPSERPRDELDKVDKKIIDYLSHEIRGPLSLMSGSIEVLKDIEDDLQRKRLTKVLENSCTYLQHLLNSILESESKCINLETIMTQALELSESSAHKREISFHFSNSITNIKNLYIPNSIKLSQVVINLINNAIKYCPGSEIKVSTSIKGDFLEISIADSGPGISAENVKSIFNFGKKITMKNASGNSNGYGLYYSKEIVHHFFNGSIELETRPDQGSTFTILIPNDKYYFKNDLQKNLLLIDDCEDFANIFKQFLKTEEYQVSHVYQRDLILQALNQKKYDLILSDFHIDGGENKDLISKIKTSVNHNTPLIILSGDKEENILFKKGQYQEFIRKPIHKKQLINVIKKYVEL